MKKIILLLSLLFSIGILAAGDFVKVIDIDGNPVLIKKSNLLKAASRIRVFHSDTLIPTQDGKFEIRGRSKHISPRYHTTDQQYLLTVSSAEGVCYRNNLKFVAIGRTHKNSNTKAILNKSGELIEMTRSGECEEALGSVYCEVN
ncbi:MAG: hypothetical protein KAQ98_02315 [Bacteriovoracaceae bacterium]|nr:hypothetical protein [Bacteriovoracaceae bacterium]